MLYEQNFTKTAPFLRLLAVLYLSSNCSFLTQWVQLGHCRLALQGIRWLSAHILQCVSSHQAHM